MSRRHVADARPQQTVQTPPQESSPSAPHMLTLLGLSNPNCVKKTGKIGQKIRRYRYHIKHINKWFNRPNAHSRITAIRKKHTALGLNATDSTIANLQPNSVKDDFATL